MDLSCHSSHRSGYCTATGSASIARVIGTNGADGDLPKPSNESTAPASSCCRCDRPIYKAWLTTWHLAHVLFGKRVLLPASNDAPLSSPGSPRNGALANVGREQDAWRC